MTNTRSLVGHIMRLVDPNSLVPSQLPRCAFPMPGVRVRLHRGGSQSGRSTECNNEGGGELHGNSREIDTMSLSYNDWIAAEAKNTAY